MTRASDEAKGGPLSAATLRRIAEQNGTSLAAVEGRHLNGVVTPGAVDEAPLDIALADIESQPVTWLWLGRIAYGKLNVIEGFPGLGKSGLCITIAAAESRGRALPGDFLVHEPGAVLIISYEDGDADTIRPRAEANDADLELVRVWKLGVRPFTIPEDLPRLRALIEERDYRLIIIDPLGAALSGAVNSYVDADVRRALSPLATLADETGAAIIIVRHITKGSTGRAILAGGGSIGIGAAARSVLVVDEDPQDPDRRILASVKCNNAVKPASLAFRLAPVFVPNAGDQPVVKFEGVVSVSADDLAMARVDSAGGQSDRQKIDEAADALRDLCASGPVDRRDVERWGKANGFPIRTLDRARPRAGIVTRSVGFGKDKRSEWYLDGDGAGSSIPANGSAKTPALTPDSANPAIPAKSSHIGALGGNGGIGHRPDPQMHPTMHGPKPKSAVAQPPSRPPQRPA